MAETASSPCKEELPKIPVKLHSEIVGFDTNRLSHTETVEKDAAVEDFARQKILENVPNFDKKNLKHAVPAEFHDIKVIDSGETKEK